jgi:hypothetical protein
MRSWCPGTILSCSLLSSAPFLVVCCLLPWQKVAVDIHTWVNVKCDFLLLRKWSQCSMLLSHGLCCMLLTFLCLLSHVSVLVITCGFVFVQGTLICFLWKAWVFQWQITDLLTDQGQPWSCVFKHVIVTAYCVFGLKMLLFPIERIVAESNYWLVSGAFGDAFSLVLKNLLQISGSLILCSNSWCSPWVRLQPSWHNGRPPAWSGKAGLRLGVLGPGGTVCLLQDMWWAGRR